MRHLILFLIYGLLLEPAFAQTTFSKIISNYPLDPENAWTVAEIEDGYIVVTAGDCLGQDIIICAVVSKLDKSGNVVWFKQFDFYPSISTSLVIQDGKIYLCGGGNQGDIQVVLYCLDMNGNILWNRVYGESDYEAGAALVFTPEGNIFVCGARYPDAPGQPIRIVYVVKTDLNGNLVDEYTYDFQNSRTLGRSIIETTDHQMIFTYDACPVSCLTDFTGGVASIDTTGNLQWNLVFPLSFQPDLPNIIQTDSATLVANWHSKTLLPNHDLTPPALFYLNLAGQIQDSLVFENQSLKAVNDLEPVWEKGLVGCGNNYIDYVSDPDPDLAGWIFRVAKNKTLIWEKSYTDTSYQGEVFALQSIAPTSDGGFIAVGTLANQMTGVPESHNWILKLDSLGCLQPGCGEVNYVSTIDESLFLKGRDILVYPNPANSYINIRLPKDFPLNNLTAFLVANSGATIKKVEVNAIETPITATEIPAGIYYVILASGNEIITSKRIVVNR